MLSREGSQVLLVWGILSGGPEFLKERGERGLVCILFGSPLQDTRGCVYKNFNHQHATGSPDLDLRLLPLVNMLLRDLEVDALDAPGAAHDLDAAEVRFEVVEHTARLLQEPLQPARREIHRSPTVVHASAALMWQPQPPFQGCDKDSSNSKQEPSK